MNVEKESTKKLIDNSGEFLERKYDVRTFEKGGSGKIKIVFSYYASYC